MVHAAALTRNPAQKAITQTSKRKNALLVIFARPTPLKKDQMIK